MTRVPPIERRAGRRTRVERSLVPRIDPVACSRCGLCLVVCPSHAVSARWTDDGAWLPHIDDGTCTRCDDCERACPDLAVEVPFEIVLEEVQP